MLLGAISIKRHRDSVASTVVEGFRSARDDVTCTGIALQPDGNIVTAVDHGAAYASYMGSVMRFDPDGSRNNGLGKLGEADFECAPDTIDACVPRDVAILPDGQIALSGIRWMPAPFRGQTDFLVGQFLPDGTPDPRFGTDGYANAGLTSFSCMPGGLAVQSDGAIVARREVRATNALPWLALPRTETVTPDLAMEDALPSPTSDIASAPMCSRCRPTARLLWQPMPGRGHSIPTERATIRSA
jgi:hypothetical protein